MTRNLSLVQALIADGANVNAEEVLYTAVESGHLEILQALIAAGMKVNQGRVLKTALREGDASVVQTLIDAGIPTNNYRTQISNLLPTWTPKAHKQLPTNTKDWTATLRNDGEHVIVPGQTYRQCMNRSRRNVHHYDALNYAKFCKNDCDKCQICSSEMDPTTYIA